MDGFGDGRVTFSATVSACAETIQNVEHLFQSSKGGNNGRISVRAALKYFRAAILLGEELSFEQLIDSLQLPNRCWTLVFCPTVSLLLSRIISHLQLNRIPPSNATDDGDCERISESFDRKGSFDGNSFSSTLSSGAQLPRSKNASPLSAASELLSLAQSFYQRHDPVRLHIIFLLQAVLIGEGEMYQRAISTLISSSHVEFADSPYSNYPLELEKGDNVNLYDPIQSLHKTVLNHSHPSKTVASTSEYSLNNLVQSHMELDTVKGSNELFTTASASIDHHSMSSQNKTLKFNDTLLLAQIALITRASNRLLEGYLLALFLFPKLDIGSIASALSLQDDLPSTLPLSDQTYLQWHPLLVKICFLLAKTRYFNDTVIPSLPSTSSTSSFGRTSFEEELFSAGGDLDPEWPERIETFFVRQCRRMMNNASMLMQFLSGTALLLHLIIIKLSAINKSKEDHLVVPSMRFILFFSSATRTLLKLPPAQNALPFWTAAFAASLGHLGIDHMPTASTNASLTLKGPNRALSNLLDASMCSALATVLNSLLCEDRFVLSSLGKTFPSTFFKDFLTKKTFSILSFPLSLHQFDSKDLLIEALKGISTRLRWSGKDFRLGSYFLGVSSITPDRSAAIFDNIIGTAENVKIADEDEFEKVDNGLKDKMSQLRRYLKATKRLNIGNSESHQKSSYTAPPIPPPPPPPPGVMIRNFLDFNSDSDSACNLTEEELYLEQSFDCINNENTIDLTVNASSAKPLATSLVSSIVPRMQYMDLLDPLTRLIDAEQLNSDFIQSLEAPDSIIDLVDDKDESTFLKEERVEGSNITDLDGQFSSNENRVLNEDNHLSLRESLLNSESESREDVILIESEFVTGTGDGLLTNDHRLIDGDFGRFENKPLVDSTTNFVNSGSLESVPSKVFKQTSEVVADDTEEDTILFTPLNQMKAKSINQVLPKKSTIPFRPFNTHYGSQFSPIYHVLDTNILINYFLELEAIIRDHSIIIAIPYVVIGELIGLCRRADISSRALSALSLLTNIAERSIPCQASVLAMTVDGECVDCLDHLVEAWPSSPLITCVDDVILHSIRSGLGQRFQLISDDTNMALKALSMDIEVLDWHSFAHSNSK